MKPRASRIPALNLNDGPNQQLNFSSKTSIWLEDEHLVSGDCQTNWKRQYKLRHNWSKGSCAVSEIEVAKEAVVPPILVQMHCGVIYMADQTDGIRAWSARGERRLIGQTTFRDSKGLTSPPTSLAIDPSSDQNGATRIIIGFENGVFCIYRLDRSTSQFKCMYKHAPSTSGVISAVAFLWPYASTMTATQQLSLYRFDDSVETTPGTATWDPPRLLHSLKSHTIWPPLSTVLKSSHNGITVSVAYSVPTYLSGWTVGIQEVKISPTGSLISSRLATAIGEHYRPLTFAAPPMMHHLSVTSATSGSIATSNTLELRHIHSKATSLSYSHPYLLVSHSDNTLTLYLVSSTSEKLSISAGSRLWGHTSSVSGVQVGGRGKAVSVSRRGDELRVWELEGGITSSAARRRLVSGKLSVQIRPHSRMSASQNSLDAVSQAVAGRSPVACATEHRSEDLSELTLSRGWVGFDEENVVVLKEQSQGRQALVFYDFT